MSGDTRQRVVAAQLASAAIEKIRGPAADPARFTTQVVPGQTITTQTVNGLKFTVTQDMQWVEPDRDHQRLRQRRHRQQLDPAGVGVGHVAGCRSDRSGPVDDRARTTGGRVLRGDRLDRREGAQRRRPPERRHGRVDHGSENQTQNTTAEGCAFFAFLTPGAYTATVTAGTGVGDQEVLIPSQATSVTVGQTSSLTFNYDTAATITITGWSGSHGNARRRASRSAIENTACSRTASTRARAGTTTLDAAVPVPGGLHGVRRELHRQQPERSRHVAQPVLQQPGHLDGHRHAGRHASTATVPLYDLPDHGHERREPRRRSDAHGDRDVGILEPAAARPRRCAPTGAASGTLADDRAGDLGRRRSQPDRDAARALDDQRDRWAPSTARSTIWRRITGVFNVTRARARPAARRSRPSRCRSVDLPAPRPDAVRTRESGYTLIESMIALSLLSVVIAAAFGVVSSMQRESMFTTDRFTAEGEAQTISDRITKDLRAGGHDVGDGCRVRVGRRERRDVLREPRRPHRSDRVARVPHAPGGNNRLPLPRGRDRLRIRRQHRQLHYLLSAGCDPHRRPVHRHVAAHLLVLRHRRERARHAGHGREPGKHRQRRHQPPGASDADRARSS